MDTTLPTRIGFPDYNNSLTIDISSPYTFNSKMFVMIYCRKRAIQDSSAVIAINGKSYNVAFTSANDQWFESNTITLFVDVGDYIVSNSTNATFTVTAFPIKD